MTKTAVHSGLFGKLSWLCLCVVFGTTIVYAQNPHGQALQINCSECHSTDGWNVDLSSMKFSHDETSFMLEGAHQNVNCKDCHSTLVFEEASGDCISCHEDLHSGSVGNDCARCHSSSNWLVDFIPELHEENGFPLIGAHNSLNCVDCHIADNNLVWNRIGNNCTSCHLEDYNATSRPNHISMGFSTNCDECHSPLSVEWGSDNFHLHFPLVNEHDRDCAACHLGNDYTSASSDCFTCHQDDYNSSREPNHSAANFSNDCVQCHSPDPVNWEIPGFHAAFPLENAHNIACNSCHLETDYTLVRGYVCFSCHQNDYNSASQPNHQALNFDTDCTKCHSTIDWSPAEFRQHDDLYFPIYSGEHQGEWNSCTECHTEAGNYAVFSCINCHEHNKNDMDDEHQDENGYRYESNACLDCHPRP